MHLYAFMAIMEGLRKVIKSMFVSPGTEMKHLELFPYAILAYVSTYVSNIGWLTASPQYQSTKCEDSWLSDS